MKDWKIAPPTNTSDGLKPSGDGTMSNHKEPLKSVEEIAEQYEEIIADDFRQNKLATNWKSRKEWLTQALHSYTASRELEVREVISSIEPKKGELTVFKDKKYEFGESIVGERNKHFFACGYQQAKIDIEKALTTPHVTNTP